MSPDRSDLLPPLSLVFFVKWLEDVKLGLTAQHLSHLPYQGTLEAVIDVKAPREVGGGWEGGRNRETET